MEATLAKVAEMQPQPTQVIGAEERAARSRQQAEEGRSILSRQRRIVD